LLNRGVILDLLGRELSRTRREDRCTVILMGDVDHFKSINDTRGHLVGDEVLREIARRMLASVRSYDFVGRYGGEEFLVVLNNCDASRSLLRGEEIRREIASVPVQTTQGPIPVTMSFGVLSSSDWELRPVEEILREVDAALYKAKAAGRNCVQFANPEVASSVPTEPLAGQPKSAR
ncbi:MAG TPA: GGDEF domain-containing protein, partial [Nitrospiraceae bacterium]|nr:GGDEF domain-containing protein [Nitrospiraceae bacterium]